MDPKEILKFCIKKGLLIEPEVFKLFSESASDEESVKLILEKITSYTRKRIITRNLFEKNKEQVSEFFLTLPKENQRSLEKLKIKLGLKIEISKEISSEKGVAIEGKEKEIFEEEAPIEILSKTFKEGKKLSVQDFVKNFKGRFYEMKTILQERTELENLISINKLSRGGQRVSIIGMVSDKRITKNNNLLLEVEDLTGKVAVLINQNKPEIYKQAEDIALDSVLGFVGSGDKEIFFANRLVFPESMIFERKKAQVEEYALFISDLQYGSKLFMQESFDRFIEYLNGNVPGTKEEVDKIKYLFIVGDLVSGVGSYPNQIRDLKIVDLEEQYQGLAQMLGKIRKDIKLIISPGNHDGVRLMEPQPPLDEKYAWPISDLKNAILTGNPASMKIAARKDFQGFEVLTYHGVSYPYYANNIPSLVSEDAMNSPEKIMAYLLKNRHLAPSHASIQYYPSEKDEMSIRKVPDIFVSGHLHKLSVSYYNNILLISGSSWEKETENQKKRGNKPDFCKVPMLNLKTRAIKILDFEKKEESA